MTDPTIRSARPEEAAAVLALWRDAEAVPGATDTEAALRGLMEDAPDALLVAETEGALVGALIAAWDGWRGNLYRLAVAPSHRRAGIAGALLAEGERRLRDRGAVRISALAIDESSAPRFWEAAG
jgi:ribosomal protein S18 acetylase RimI-like enzyme